MLDQLMGGLSASLGTTLPSLLGGLLILLAGWIIALVVRAGIRRGLGLLKLDERLAESTGSEMKVEAPVATISFWLAMALVLVAFFNALDLPQVSGSIQGLVDQVLEYLPRVLMAGILLLVAWVLGSVLRSLLNKLLAATTLDDKLSAHAGTTPMSENLANVAFWLVMLLVLPAVLGALQLGGLLAPVQGMVDSMLAALPNVLGALAFGAIGWFVAKILRDLVTNLAAVAGADALGERAGLSGNMTLSKLAGLVVYVFVFVPALIGALGVLQIESISVPATQMLSSFMAAIPNLLGAAIILAVAWVVSRFIAGLLTSLLGGAGFDALPERLGIGGIVPEGTSASEVAGRIVVFFVMLFAVVEAAGRVGFGQVSDLVGQLIAFGGDVLLGLVIISVGFWLSNLARDAVSRVSGDGASGVAGIARYAILGIVLAMGLRAMGLADDIVNLAFGLTLGSVAVAVALAFGLGGREAAGKQMERWLRQMNGE